MAALEEATMGCDCGGGEYSEVADDSRASSATLAVVVVSAAGCSLGLCSVEPDAEPLDGTRVTLLAFPGDDGALVAARMVPGKKRRHVSRKSIIGDKGRGMSNRGHQGRTQEGVWVFVSNLLGRYKSCVHPNGNNNTLTPAFYQPQINQIWYSHHLRTHLGPKHGCEYIFKVG